MSSPVTLVGDAANCQGTADTTPRPMNTAKVNTATALISIRHHMINALIRTNVYITASTRYRRQRQPIVTTRRRAVWNPGSSGSTPVLDDCVTTTGASSSIRRLQIRSSPSGRIRPVESSAPVAAVAALCHRPPMTDRDEQTSKPIYRRCQPTTLAASQPRRISSITTIG